MKNSLTQYLEETYQNTVSRNCIKIILKSKTEQEYIDNIQKQINKKIKEITELKQSISVMDQFVSYLTLNEDAQLLENFNDTLLFYMNESNKLCNELSVKITNLHDYLDIFAIAKANIDMNDNLLNSERDLIKKYGDKKERVITGLKRISKSGLRVYVKADEVPRVLNGLGIAIISTSKGLMTDKEARANNLGGEVLAYIW